MTEADFKKLAADAREHVVALCKLVGLGDPLYDDIAAALVREQLEALVRAAMRKEARRPL